jgi:hypothetical protein
MSGRAARRRDRLIASLFETSKSGPETRHQNSTPSMTRTRYNAYRYLLSSLELANFNEAERELLRDAAEGFLLAAALDSEELVELALTVVVTLEAVVESGRMSPWAAEQAKLWVDACGPMPEPLIPAFA